MAWISAERVAHALHNLGEWRKTVQDQGSRHLLPLLALLEKGAGGGAAVHFDETPHEFEFWDRYFKLNGAEPDKPYFNPITARRAEKGYPHSNAATIRKNTFAGKWHAATRMEMADGDYWELSGNYADIVREKVLTKGGAVHRAPVLDLSIILFRAESFPDDATGVELLKRFRNRFSQADDDFHKLYEFRDELPERLFVVQPTPPDYDSAIRAALIDDISTPADGPPPTPLIKIADPDDPVLAQVQELLTIGTSGLILKGPPGTGKTYYAQRIAQSLVSDPLADIFRVQFHPSYGYEDFVEGYRPDSGSVSGFTIVEKVFIQACRRAAARPDGFVVLIVDEINRGDPARVFGELLTYIERPYRNVDFALPFSGNSHSVPLNLLLIGTMNPFDRSVSHVDAAFVRRFDHIEIAPSREVVEALLEKGGSFTPDQVALIGTWFEAAQKMIPVGLGHSFFKDVKDIDTLKTIWRYRIRPTAETLMELDDSIRDGFVKSFEALLGRLEGIVGVD